MDRSGQRVLSFEHLSKKYGSSVLLAGANENLRYGEKVVLLGDNGSGKTTLFKLLLGLEAQDSGKVELGARVDIGYLAQQEPIQDEKQTLLDYFCKEGSIEEGEARHILAGYLFYGAEVYKRLGSLSGGEWSRVRLALLVRRKPNLLLLDEPTNHLDIASREALEDALGQFQGTVLAISHDRYFINRLAQRIWELKQGLVTSYLGNYDEYRTRRLLTDPVHAGGNSSKAVKREAKASETVVQTVETERRATDISGNQMKANARRCQQLEKDIGLLEADLTKLNAELEQLNQLGDAIQLELKWFEKEKKQEELNFLLEQWMELSN